MHYKDKKRWCEQVPLTPHEAIRFSKACAAYKVITSVYISTSRSELGFRSFLNCLGQNSSLPFFRQ